MIKIAHLGDGHLGKRQYGLRKREEDTKVAVAHCFTEAIKQAVDVIILPGDMFDTAKPSADNVRHLARLVGKARGAGIAVIGIDGNHDNSATSWLEVCDVDTFKDYEPIIIKDTSFYGLNNYRSNAFQDKLCETVDHFVKEGTNIDVFIIHQAVAEMAGFSGLELKAQWVAEQLSMIKTKYVAMGDIHDYSEMEFEGMRFCYPGSCEMTAMGERREKFWVNVVIDGDKVDTQCMDIPVRKIKEFFLDTYEDIGKMITEVQSSFQEHLVVPYVSKDILDGHKTVYRLLGELNVMARVMTATKDKEGKSATPEIDVPMWERSEAIDTVTEAITSFHKPDSDEHQLIRRLLASPLSVNTICEEWLNGN